MARRALYDEMPGIIARLTVRAIVKGATQKLIDDRSSNLGVVGSLLSLAAKVGSVITETADERSWRTLPGYFSIARLQLTPGQHKIAIQTQNGAAQSHEITVSGKYEVISFRIMNNRVFVVQP